MLRSNPSSLYKRLLKDIESVSISDLTWKSPLTSQVLSDMWEKIRKLPKKLYNEFMVGIFKIHRSKTNLNSALNFRNQLDEWFLVPYLRTSR